MFKLQDDSFPIWSLGTSANEFNNEEHYSCKQLNLKLLRVGDYRLICQIKDKELIILVVDTAHRKEIYKSHHH